MRSKTRKRRGGMDHEAPPPYSPPRSPPPYRRTPPPLTTREWSKLKGILRLRPIAFDIRTPTTIVFNSHLPENNMAVLRMQFPREQLPSTVNASPEVNDSIVAEDRTNGNKYLLGTVVSKNPLKIRTPPQYDPPPAPAARLELNNENFKILVINEQRPRPPVGGGTKKRKTSKGKTQKRKGGHRRTPLPSARTRRQATDGTGTQSDTPMEGVVFDNPAYQPVRMGDERIKRAKRNFKRSIYYQTMINEGRNNTDESYDEFKQHLKAEGLTEAQASSFLRFRPPLGVTFVTGGKRKTKKRKRGKKNQRKRRTRRGGGTNGNKVKFYLGEKEEDEKYLGEIRDEKKKKSTPKQRKLPVTPGKVTPLTSRASPPPTLFNAPITPEERLEKEKAKVARRQNRAKWWRLQAKNEYDELLRQIDEDEIPLPTTPEERLQLKLKVHNARRKAYPAPDA